MLLPPQILGKEPVEMRICLEDGSHIRMHGSENAVRRLYGGDAIPQPGIEQQPQKGHRCGYLRFLRHGLAMIGPPGPTTPADALSEASRIGYATPSVRPNCTASFLMKL